MKKDFARYSANKTLRHNTPFLIINGEGFHLLNGVKVSQADFDKRFPLTLMSESQRENPDRKTASLYL